jgi:O-antigen/teichoic acid export membrane protein
MNIKKAAFNGMLWVFIDYFVVKGVSFLGAIFLARILIPEDFGLIAMISVFITFGNVILDSGLSSSLIRNSENDDLDYSTVFFTNVIFGVVIYFLFFLSSQIIASFFGQQKLVNLIKIYSLSFVIMSLSSVHTTILNRELNFKKIAILNVPSVFLGLIFGVFFALKDYGFWSIIIMYLTTQFVFLIGLWLCNSWRPKFIFSVSKFKYHFKYGSKLLLSNILSGTTLNIYNLFIGKYYSVNSSGIFDRSTTFTNYPLVVLTQIIGKVSFPLMSKIKNEHDRFNTVFIKLLSYTFFVTAPIMIILSACSEMIIKIMLGEKWLDAIPIFKILCIGGMFYTIQALNVNVIKTYGKTNYILIGEFFLKFVQIISIIISINFGFQFLILTIVFNSIITLFVNMYFSNKILKIGFLKQINLYIPTLITAFLTFFFIEYLSLNEYVVNLSVGFKLSFLAFSGFVFYLFASLFFNLKIIKEILSVIHYLIKKEI